jgi:uncharacterized NAD(P)/FAD-binding protein YdhS
MWRVEYTPQSGIGFLQQQLSMISKNIKRIRENRQANADSVRKQKEGVEKDIRELQKKFIVGHQRKPTT